MKKLTVVVAAAVVACVAFPASARAQDMQPPTVALTAPAEGAYVHGDVKMTATASDDVAVERVAFTFNGFNAGSDYTAPYEATFTTVHFFGGEVTVTARAFDTAGQLSAISQRKVTIDNSKPTVQITGGTPEHGVVGAAGAAFEFAAADTVSPIAAVECALDAGAFAPCDSSTRHALAGLAAGAHNFSVRSRDSAGTYSDAVVRSFTVDLAAPDTEIVGGRAAGSSSTERDATFAFKASEPGGTFQCRLYVSGTTAPPFAPCSGEGSHAATGLSPATYVFDVRAVDAVGNVDSTPASRSFTVAAPTGGPDPLDPAKPVDPGTPQKPVVPAKPADPAKPSPADAPKPPLEEIDAGITWEWDRLGTRTRPNYLYVKRIPKGATVEVLCKGKGCAFAKKAFAPKKARIDVASAFRKKRIAAGGTVEIRVAKAGMITKVFVFTMRPKALPTFKELCLAPGAARATAC
jgi:FlaG/FlaF family flagellin (archaellin)